MAHFAELDENNIVTRVMVFDNSICDDLPFPESEQCALPRIAQVFPGKWRQTSYNNNFRGHFAGIGWKFNEELDVWEPPQWN